MGKYQVDRFKMKNNSEKALKQRCFMADVDNQSKCCCRLQSDKGHLLTIASTIWEEIFRGFKKKNIFPHK
jgi:hypothetical protein